MKKFHLALSGRAKDVLPSLSLFLSLSLSLSPSLSLAHLLHVRTPSGRTDGCRERWLVSRIDESMDMQRLFFNI